MSVHNEIKAVSSEMLRVMTGECIAWRKSGKLESNSTFEEFVNSLEDDNYRGDVRAVDDLVVIEAARRFSQGEKLVTITKELAEQVYQALADARRYGAGDWTDLEDQLNAISQQMNQKEGQPSSLHRQIGNIRVELTNDAYDYNDRVYTIEVSHMVNGEFEENDGDVSSVAIGTPMEEINAYLDQAAKIAYLMCQEHGNVKNSSGRIDALARERLQQALSPAP